MCIRDRNNIVDPVQEEPEEVVPEEAKPEGPTALDYAADTAIGLGAVLET